MHVNVEVAQHGATRTYSVQNRPSAYTSASLFEIWISDFGVSTQTKIDPTAPTLSPALYFSFFLSWIKNLQEKDKNEQKPPQRLVLRLTFRDLEHLTGKKTQAKIETVHVSDWVLLQSKNKSSTQYFMLSPPNLTCRATCARPRTRPRLRGAGARRRWKGTQELDHRAPSKRWVNSRGLENLKV